MSETILKIEDLQVHYGGIEAVKGISFDVQEGQIVTLIGSNGAGKSSTLRTISGLVKPSGGKITFRGEDITGKDPTQIVTQGVTLVPEGRRIFPDMTVLENLKIGAYLRKDDLSEDLEWVYSLFPRLKERSWQAGGTLSGGEQQMLAVGRALMSRPKLLMMDEPSLGLAPLVVRDIFSIIQEINKQGVTILLIEQNANMALKIADVGYVLETGRITLTGSGEELLTNDAVRSAHNCIRNQTGGCLRVSFRFFGTFLDRARPILYNVVENHRTIEVCYEKVFFRISGAVSVARAADCLRNRRPDRQDGDGRRPDLCQELQ